MREPFVVALPTRHSLVRNRKTSVSELAGEGFILYPRDQRPGLFEQINEICKQAGFRPRVVQHASNISTIVSFVAAGLGIAIVPQSVSKIPWSGVVYRPLHGTSTESVIALAYRQGLMSVLQQRFIQCMANRQD